MFCFIIIVPVTAKFLKSEEITFYFFFTF
jgi:hypothetical protein